MPIKKISLAGVDRKSKLHKTRAKQESIFLVQKQKIDNSNLIKHQFLNSPLGI